MAPRSSIHVNLIDRLPQIIGDLPDAVKEALREGAEVVAEGAKERVPQDSGDLRDAIHTEEVDGGWAVTAGDETTYYGHIVERGGVNHPARPFLTPAYEAASARILDLVDEAVDRL